jgi:hypothetical protein
LYCVEWRGDDQPAAKKKKSSPDEQFMQWYNGVKISINTISYLPKELVSLNRAELPNDKQELLVQLTEIKKNMEVYKRWGALYYDDMGYALAKLKRIYYTVCDICKRNEADMFCIISCGRCVKASQGNTFFHDVLGILGVQYSKSHINFLIQVSGLCNDFPKFRCAVWTITDVKKYMPYLRDKIKMELNEWN